MSYNAPLVQALGTYAVVCEKAVRRDSSKPLPKFYSIEHNNSKNRSISRSFRSLLPVIAANLVTFLINSYLSKTSHPTNSNLAWFSYTTVSANPRVHSMLIRCRRFSQNSVVMPYSGRANSKIALPTRVHLLVQGWNIEDIITYKKKLLYTVPNAWNSIPQAIRIVETIARFKKELKSHLLR